MHLFSPSTIWKPAVFHGHHRRDNYFEGWYYKIASPGGEHSCAIIAGIFISRDPQKHHAFIQFLDGMTGESSYHPYPPSAFSAARDEFFVQIGENQFSTDRILLEIDSPERCVRGELHFTDLTPWPVSLFSPGVMGPYSFVPFMQCNHGILSFDHEIRGSLSISGQVVTFTDGRGYCEKDWGAAFPDAYVWMQSNHFGVPGTSFFGSIATIPWLKGAFTGYIAGLWHRGVLYRFTTYTGARTELLDVDARSVRWYLRGGKDVPHTSVSTTAPHAGYTGYRLEVNARRARGATLLAPYGEMVPRVLESLSGALDVRLSGVLPNGDERLLFAETGRHAGLEVQGALERIITEAGVLQHPEYQ
ncbi:MAG: hypothetical protein IT326_00810 [Anaerolineae bacterium]|nr:hypothetical protein [Anaerolineae bacterium]